MQGNALTVVRTVSRDGPVVAYCSRYLQNSLPLSARLITVRQSPSVALESRNYLVNLLCALNQAKAGIVYVCDDDCLYHASYFYRKLDADAYNYTKSAFYLHQHTFSRRFKTASSSLAGHRDVLREGIWSRIRDPQFGTRGSRCEPGEGDGVSSHTHVVYQDLSIPYIDIRHEQNLTSHRSAYDNPKRAPREIDYWGKATDLWLAVHGE